MRKKITAFVLCCSMIIVSTQAFASTSSSAQKNLDDKKKQISDLQKNQDALEDDIETNQSNLTSIMSSISTLEGQLETTSDKIEQTKNDLAAAQTAQQEQYNDMKLRIQYMYENGDSFSYINTFLSSENLSDMLNRINYISEVNTYDRNLLTNYENTTAEIASLQDGLNQKMSELEQMQADYAGQRDSLQASITALKAQSTDYEAQITKAKEDAAKYKAQAAAEKTAAQSSNTTSSSSKKTSSPETSGGSGSSTNTGVNPGYNTGVSASDVISFAKKFVGNPYVFGGTDINNGIDCSGYIRYIFGNFGISLPRTSYGDRSVGKEVSYDSIAPGDIVCYDGHVAMYIGGGQIIHAIDTAHGIGITGLTGSNSPSKILTIRRVL